MPNVYLSKNDIKSIYEAFDFMFNSPSALGCEEEEYYKQAEKTNLKISRIYLNLQKPKNNTHFE